MPEIDYLLKIRVALIRIDVNNDLKAEDALNERQLNKLLQNILFVNSCCSDLRLYTAVINEVW